MNPEITWTDAGPDQFTATYAGREWALLRYNRRSGGRPAGWYLHATETPGVLADDGRYMARGEHPAQRRGAEAILTAEIFRLRGELAAATASRDLWRADAEHDSAEVKRLTAELEQIRRAEAYDAEQAAVFVADNAERPF